jgi:hypothetical protein
MTHERQEVEPPKKLMDPTKEAEGFVQALLGIIKAQQRRIEVAEAEVARLRKG